MKRRYLLKVTNLKNNTVEFNEYLYLTTPTYSFEGFNERVLGLVFVSNDENSKYSETLEKMQSLIGEDIRIEISHYQIDKDFEIAKYPIEMEMTVSRIEEIKNDYEDVYRIYIKGDKI